jgi:hypothetical protein
LDKLAAKDHPTPEEEKYAQVLLKKRREGSQISA